MIRWGELRDRDELVRLAERCWNEELPGLNWMPLDIRFMEEVVTTDPSIVTIVSEKEGRLDGVIIGQLTRAQQSETTIAVSLWLYVEPESRGMAPKRLVKWFERWAMDNGAKLVQLSTVGSTRVERNLRFFKLMDYSFSGVVMIKRIDQ